MTGGVEDLIVGQVEAMKQGHISDEEMESNERRVREVMTEGDSDSPLPCSPQPRILGGMAAPSTCGCYP